MPIFTHVVVGTNDLEAARRFYDAIFAPFGIRYLGPLHGPDAMYGVDHPEFMVTKPRNGEPACHANGGTIGFMAPSREAVDQFHAQGLANGGTCEGKPGPRPFPPDAYGAYLRDPDGNKLTAYYFGS